jgi:hypothetical protein
MGCLAFLQNLTIERTWKSAFEDVILTSEVPKAFPVPLIQALYFTSGASNIY